MPDQVIKIIRNEYGTLMKPNLHDGFVLGVMLQKDGSVNINMSDEDHNEYITMNCQGLDALYVSNFMETNILFDIRIRKAMSISGSELKKIIAEMYGQGDFIPFQRWQKSTLLVTEISPSLGCTIIVICEEIRFLQRN